MYIEAVTVCVDYADILKEALIHNKGHFNKWVVVTTSKDLDTRRLCQHHHVQCVIADEMITEGKINKAIGINAGLARLDLKGWVLHIDADIILPTHTRSILEKAALDPYHVYGCDRMMVNSYQEWAEYQYRPRPVHENFVFTHLSAFPMGVRVNQYLGDGYQVIGFFQLWNPLFSGVYQYPVENCGFDRTDVLFQKQWERSCRDFLPEIVVIHLDSEKADMGANWNGRTTRPFMPFSGPVPDRSTFSEVSGDYYRDSWWKRLWKYLVNGIRA